MNTWAKHKLIQQQQKYWHFDNASAYQCITKPPLEATPIDIIHSSEESITMWRAMPIISTTQNQILTIMPWFLQPVKALDHIVGMVSLLYDTDDIKELFHSRARVDIASDGGHDPETGISTFGWVVSANKLLIAKG
jgi:hypothetical protein